MASLFTRQSRVFPLVAGVAVAGIAGTTYYTTRRPLLLDSPTNAPTKTFSFPSSMLFSRDLTVTKIEQINHDTKRITFALPGGEREVSGVPAGSAILTQHTPSDRWFPVLRPYTPVSSPTTPGTLELVVKAYPQGKASNYLHSLTPGSHLTVRGPIPSYTWKPSPTTPRDVLFIAGGAGITPIYSLAAGVLADSADKTRIQLVWGVNGTRDIVLRKELEDLEARYPDRLKVTYCVSGKEGEAGAPSLGDEGKWKKGYVNAGVLKEVIARCEAGLGDEQGKKVFLCGPPGMEKGMSGAGGVLAELGIEKKKVHTF